MSCVGPDFSLFGPHSCMVVCGESGGPGDFRGWNAFGKVSCSPQLAEHPIENLKG